MKRKQFIIGALILTIGITIGIGLGFWLCDNRVNGYTVYEWSQSQEKQER